MSELLSAWRMTDAFCAPCAMVEIVVDLVSIEDATVVDDAGVTGLAVVGGTSGFMVRSE